MHTRTWHLELDLFEDEEHTRAEAVLRTDVGTSVRHAGTARRNPADPNVPQIGDELAVARALAGISHGLLEAATADVELNASS